MGKPKNKQPLSKFKEAIPNRVELAYESMFAATEQERAAAQVLLDLLPREVRTNDEQIQYNTDIWLKAPSAEELKLSPMGRQILEMVADSKPMGGEIPAEMMAELEKLKSTPGPVAEPAAPAAPAESANQFAEQLVGWPPASQKPQPPAMPEEPPDWIQHLNKPKVIPWVDDCTNHPI